MSYLHSLYLVQGTQNDDMLYLAIDIYKRAKSEVVRYRCFQVIPSGRYCVQSADFYRPSSDSAYLDNQHIQLLIDQAPDERSPTFATLEEAIAYHDTEFLG